MTVNERIAGFCKYKGLKKKELRDLGLGTSRGISDILDGRRKPGHEFIIAFLEKFSELNPLWLILGEGEMITDSLLKQENEPEELYIKRLINHMEQTRDYLQNLLKKIKEDNSGLTKEK
jgi:hypothetical protein